MPDVKIVTAMVTDKSDVVTVKNGTADNVLVCNVNYYQVLYLFARIEQLAHPDVPHRDAKLSHVCTLNAPFRVHSFNFLHHSPIATFYREVSSEYVDTLLTRCNAADRYVPSTSTSLLLIALL